MTDQRVGVVTLEITDECPLRCAYCYKAAGVADPTLPVLDFPVLLEHVKRLVRFVGARTVALAGGEPLTSGDLFPWIRELRALGLRCTLLTDGGMVTPTLAAALREAGVSLVQPTLLGGDAGVHDGLKGPGSFRATVAGIGHLVDARVPVSVAFVATRRNADAFRRAVELCFALGVRTVAFSRYTSAGDPARDHDLTPSADQLRRCLEIGQWANRTLDMRVKVAIAIPHCVASGLELPDLPLGHCALTGDTPGLTLDARGDLRACAVSPTRLGNLTLEPLPEILERAAREFFPCRSLLPQKCRTCEAVSRCRGGCRESAQRTAGPCGRDPLMI